MDCGIPFCHNGCPLDNIIPDWNDLVFRGAGGRPRGAARDQQLPRIHRPGLPAPCEAACTLNIIDAGDDQIDRVRDRRPRLGGGLVAPEDPAHRTGKRVAVVGSGPAGLACAQQLTRAGHTVVVFEKSDRIGGLLRYGIPDFKMEKHWIDRRMAQMQAKVSSSAPRHVGGTIPVERSVAEYDALVLAAAPKPRATFRSKAVTCRASTSRWISSPSRTPASPAAPRTTATRSSRPAARSW